MSPLGKFFIILCAVWMLFVLLLYNSTHLSDNVHYYWNQNCFISPSNSDIRLLEEIDETSQHRPSINESSKQIFFLETSCAQADGVIHLTARQICAIESVARWHPNHKIYVIFIAPVGIEMRKPEAELLRNLVKHENIYLRRANITKFAKNTPLEQFFDAQEYRKSKFFNTHLSDILRFLTLYKYGGMYLDTDIVCLRNFEELGMNFVAAEAPTSLGSSVINFGNDELGRIVALECLKELRSTFDGSIWAHNGPGVLTRVISRLCETTFTKLMTPEACSGFKVLSVETFAPVLWTYHKFYFQTENAKDVMKVVEKAYVIHLFNHMNKYIPVEKTSDVAYALIAKKQCPDMFGSSSKTF
ncbi:lactosylceramide 4-alpha-galactosyltransferase-like [Culicoides brevitarsis]|uniref:lactosylceramide 4-alpha-galactosyltransferase-like n=1 Tax=Culicoides brevitarsis TaxID=469753 RepID=UPI00307C36F6